MTKKALAPSAKVTARDAKGSKFMSVVEAAYNKAGLDEVEAQRLNESKGLNLVVGNYIEENRSPGSLDHKMACRYGYHLVDIRLQVKRLCAIFDHLGSANAELVNQIESGEIHLPEGAENWFAVPNWRKCGEAFGLSYLDAIKTVLKAIRASRAEKFNCLLDFTGKIYPLLIRQSRKSEDSWMRIRDAQGDPDILIIPGQLGYKYYGLTDTQAKERITSSEFSLGVFENSSILLTHPDRIINATNPSIYCSGDEISVNHGTWLSKVPYFGFYCGGMELKTCSSDTGYYNLSTSSGFLDRII